MGYDAMTLGDLELYRGVEYVERILASTEVPVTLANVKFRKSGEPIGQEYVIVEKLGIRFGIIGLLAQDFGEGIEKFEGLGYDVEDPFVVAARLVPRVEQEADLIVVLAHMGSSQNFQLPKQVKGIDLLVFGHYPGTVASAQIEGAVTIRSGQRGQHVGDTVLVVNPDNEIVSYKGRAVALTVKDVCADPLIAADVASLKMDVEQADKQVQLRQDIEANKDKLVLGQDHFLGDLKCARCHFDQYTTWKETPHAKAWATLVDAHADKDTNCLECHVTGYRQPGGFRGIGAEQDMRNVQCESCHGMGTQHDMLNTAAMVGEQACLTCHDENNSPAFDFESYWEEVVH
jgi:hypothetical protein